MSDELPAGTYPLGVAMQPQPRLHWAWVFLFSLLTLFVFWYVWCFVQARWVQRVQGRSFAYGWTIICIVLASISLVVDLVKLAAQHQLTASGSYFDGLLLGVYLVTVFALQQELEDAIPRLRLSSAMTFFFGPVYFQFHLQKLPAQS
jgi:hypothetical protein